MHTRVLHELAPMKMNRWHLIKQQFALSPDCQQYAIALLGNTLCRVPSIAVKVSSAAWHAFNGLKLLCRCCHRQFNCNWDNGRQHSSGTHIHDWCKLSYSAMQACCVLLVCVETSCQPLLRAAPTEPTGSPQSIQQLLARICRTSATQRVNGIKIPLLHFQRLTSDPLHGFLSEWHHARGQHPPHQAVAAAKQQYRPQPVK